MGKYPHKELIFGNFCGTDKKFTKLILSVLEVVWRLNKKSFVIPFVQFKKREKRPWRSVTFSKVAG